jgi:hypothetical protein
LSDRHYAAMSGFAVDDGDNDLRVLSEHHTLITYNANNLKRSAGIDFRLLPHLSDTRAHKIASQ